MNDFKCVVPKILFGAGRRKELGETAKVLGRKAFLALDPYLERSGLGAEIEKLLRDAGLGVIAYTRIAPDPDCFAADEAGALARKEGCDLVVAVGGGSVIDFGKGWPSWQGTRAPPGNTPAARTTRRSWLALGPCPSWPFRPRRAPARDDALRRVRR